MPTSSIYFFVMNFYWSLANLINLIGLPPHTWLAGTTLPGGTTLLGRIIEPSSSLAPSKMTELAPTKTPLPILQLYSVHPAEITAVGPTSSSAESPEGKQEAVWRTQLSPIET